MRTVIVAAILVAGAAFALPVRAQTNHDQNDIAQLKVRVTELEAQVRELSKIVEPLKEQRAAEERRLQLRDRFEQKISEDRKKYTSGQLREAEQLYQVANQKWGSPEAAESLRSMIEKFPDINRTGCAALYVAQNSKGDERAQLLRDCIEKYGDCFYGDGVQVGAYARFLLAHDNRERGENALAEALENELRTRFPDAIDHGGNLLSTRLGSKTE